METDCKPASEMTEDMKNRFIKALKMGRVKACIAILLVIAFFVTCLIIGPIISGETRPTFYTISYLAIILFFVACIPYQMISYKQIMSWIQNNEFTWYRDRVMLRGSGHAWVNNHYMWFLSEHIIEYDTWFRCDVCVIQLNKRPLTINKNICIRT